MTSEHIGKEVPDVELHETSPSDKVNIKDLSTDKKIVIIGVPGPFTPTCSSTHVPSYLEKYDKLKEAGVDIIAFLSITDAFVMNAWKKDQNVGDKIRMFADVHSKLSNALGVVFDASAILGYPRCKRFVLIIENKVIKGFFVEEDQSKMIETAPDKVLEFLKK